MDIRHLIAKECREFSPDTSVAQAVKGMVDSGSTACLVVEAGSEVGIFSEHDLMERVVARGRSVEDTLLRDVMTVPCKKVPHDLSLEDALEYCSYENVRNLAVVDENDALVGTVSYRAMVAAHTDALARDMQALVNYMGADCAGG